MKISLLFLSLLAATLSAAPAIHLTATAATPDETPVPEGKRIPFGWQSTSVPTDGPATVKWDSRQLPPGKSICLRIASALDCRENLRLVISIPSDPEPLGEINFAQAPVFQIGEITLDRKQAEKVLSEGIQITRKEGKAPFRIFSPASGKNSAPALLQPHLMIAGNTDPWEEFMLRLEEDNGTIQTFSWMEGCLLDGVYDLSLAFPNRKFSKALSERLDLYLIGKDLIYENPRSVPVDNRIYGIEGTLPFAAIARTNPDHPSIDLAVDFWAKELKKSGFAEGSIQDGGTCSAEGSYTVAHPMMAIARERNDDELAALALDQIRIRAKLLRDREGNIFLRNSNGNQNTKNWARGAAWFYLGMIRTIAEAPEGMDTTDLRAEALDSMKFLLSHQQDDGLWRNFMHDSEQTVDTSGSAGIAAALAIGFNEGILPKEAHAAALRTRKGLTKYLTADGLLDHGTPSNRASEAKGNRRLIFPVGMGLAAQLIAALEKSDSH